VLLFAPEPPPPTEEFAGPEDEFAIPEIDEAPPLLPTVIVKFCPPDTG
jgi:hypothetical protein